MAHSGNSFVIGKQADKSAPTISPGTTKGVNVSWLLEAGGDDYQPAMRKP